MNAVFADSFYYIALLNGADQWHPAVVRATQTLRHPLVTTSWVLAEVADALSPPRTRPLAHRFLARLPFQTETQIIAADEAWFARGLALYGARPDKGWSLTDCISFEVMRGLGLAEALTGDHHFEQAGFRAMLREA